MYTEDHISPVLPIKYIINKDGESTTPSKLATGRNLQYHILCIIFSFVVHKANASVGAKSLNISQQAQKGFCNIFIGITQHQKGCLVYAIHRLKIEYSYNVGFDENFFSALVYIINICRSNGYITVCVIHTLCYI